MPARLCGEYTMRAILLTILIIGLTSASQSELTYKYNFNYTNISSIPSEKERVMNSIYSSPIDSNKEVCNRTISECMTQHLCKENYMMIALDQIYNNPKLRLEARNEWEVTYEIDVVNQGDIKIRDVLLNATLPANLSYIISYYKYASQGILPYPTRIQNPNKTTRYLSWFLGDLIPDSHIIIVLVASYQDHENVDLELNRVSAVGKALCMKYQTNEISATGPIRSIAVNQNVSDISTVNGNSIITYSISVKNSGQCSLTDVKLIDTLPKNMTYLNSTPGAIDLRKKSAVLSLGNLDIGSVKKIELKAAYSSKDPSIQRENNSIEVTGYGFGIPVSATNNNALIPTASRVLITQFINKTEEKDNLTIVTYDVGVSNQDYVKITNANLTNILPKNMSYINAVYLDGNKLKEISRIKNMKTSRTIIKWELGDLDTGKIAKHVFIKASYKKENTNIMINDSQIMLRAEIFGNPVNSTIFEALQPAD
jgi:uncharacterized repeat protein (TIGR01451 family)